MPSAQCAETSMQVVTIATNQKPFGLTDWRQDPVRNYHHSLRNDAEGRISGDSVELQKSRQVAEIFHKCCKFFDPKH